MPQDQNVWISQIYLGLILGCHFHPSPIILSQTPTLSVHRALLLDPLHLSPLTQITSKKVIKTRVGWMKYFQGWQCSNIIEFQFISHRDLSVVMFFVQNTLYLFSLSGLKFPSPRPAIYVGFVYFIYIEYIKHQHSSVSESYLNTCILKSVNPLPTLLLRLEPDSHLPPLVNQYNQSFIDPSYLSCWYGFKGHIFFFLLLSYTKHSRFHFAFFMYPGNHSRTAHRDGPHSFVLRMCNHLF